MLTCQLCVLSGLFAQVNLQGCSVSPSYNCTLSTPVVSLTPNDRTYFLSQSGTSFRSKCDFITSFICSNPFPFIIAHLYQDETVNDDTYTNYSYKNLTSITCDYFDSQNYEFDPDFRGDPIFNWKDSPP